MHTFRFAAATAVLGTLVAISSAQFDQIGAWSAASTTGAGNVSQQFEPANAAFHTINIEDMTLGSSSMQINSVDAVFLFFNGAGPTTAITDWHFAVFSAGQGVVANGPNNTGDVSDQTGITGANVTYTQPNFGGVTGNILVHVVLPTPVALAANTTYWFGLAGSMPFTPGGEIGIMASLTSDPSSAPLNARLMNGGGGFALAGNNAPIVTPTNSAYRLGMTATPEPGTWAALGLGALALIRRRRSNKA